MTSQVQNGLILDYLLQDTRPNICNLNQYLETVKYRRTQRGNLEFQTQSDFLHQLQRVEHVFLTKVEAAL